MGLLSEIQRRRAESERAAALSDGPAERVVVSEGAGRPHSIVLEQLDRERWMVHPSTRRIVRRFPVKDMTGGGA